MWLLAKFAPRPVRRDEGDLPACSVVIVAHNEAANIGRKLRNLLASDRADRIREIIVGSDGSTDDTAGVIASVGDPRIRLLAFPVRRGKATTLNDAVGAATADIVVLADSRKEFDPAAIGELLAGLADERVGVVSGELIIRNASNHSAAAEGIGVYWKYEKFIRKCEARSGSVPGATGAIYAIRRCLFRPIDPTTILDDVAIAMQAVSQGFRYVFEERAVAFDEPSQSPGQEAIRKRRTIAGAAQLVRLYPRWILPWRNPIWSRFVSHKLLRLASPLLLAGAFVSNVALAADRSPLDVSLLAMQVWFYLAAAVGWMFQQAGPRSSLFGAPLMFLALNTTTVAALWDAVRGRYRVTWGREVGSRQWLVASCFNRTSRIRVLESQCLHLSSASSSRHSIGRTVCAARSTVRWHRRIRIWNCSSWMMDRRTTRKRSSGLVMAASRGCGTSASRTRACQGHAITGCDWHAANSSRCWIRMTSGSRGKSKPSWLRFALSPKRAWCGPIWRRSIPKAACSTRAT
jgi:glycosyltransferase involved in cell wall biosynthesis